MLQCKYGGWRKTLWESDLSLCGFEGCSDLPKDNGEYYRPRIKTRDK